MSPEYFEGSCIYLGILSNTSSSLFCGVSLLTLTAISVDRLLALLLGLRYRHVVTLRRAWIFVIVCWLSNAANVMIFLYNAFISEAITCIVLLLCIVASTFCYTKIYLKLRHHQLQVHDHVHQGQPSGGGIPLNIARYRKTVSSAMWLQITLLACYLPFALIAALQAMAVSTGFAGDVTFSLVLFNSTLNPFLYCWKMRDVRQAVKATIRQFCGFSS